MQFSEFNFTESLLDGLYAMGFDKPTPIQEQAIPVILENKDLIACAQTGTGKTAAFVLPILNKLAVSNDNHLNTLILAPTRELALQIDKQIEGFSYFLGISSIPVYGGGDGEAFINQKRALEMGAEIIIATPGRLIALLNSGKINFSKLKHLVLDEADRMLDMGFYDDIMKIISYLPKNRQTILFSATMPPNIRKLTDKIMSSSRENINIATSQPADGIKQKVFYVNEDKKFNLLLEWLKNTKYESIIVFAGTKEVTKTLEKQLNAQKVPVKSFHSDLEQAERVDLINAFKHRKIRVIIGTDILSRGIDIEGIDLVINYDVPGNPEDYIHRIGRTARGDSFGTAITFINDKDRGKFARIKKLVKNPIEQENLTDAEISDKPIFEKKTFFKKKKKSTYHNKA